MNRNLNDLYTGTFDLIVIGGGIFGACAAWDGAQRGLSVAVIERSDFGAATSANSYKIIHGGIRYIQHGDVYRVRQSSAERRTFLKIAPHLVHPLPIAVPTYGHGMKSYGALRVGMGLYDVLTADKDRGSEDPERRVGWGRMMSRSETVSLFPGLDPTGLTGAALFSDGQIYNPPRLVLAVLKSAVGCGAVAANYVEAVGVLRSGTRVVGVEARDVLTGATFEIRGKVVLNAAGPYAEQFLRRALDLPLNPPGSYSRDACFVVRKRSVHPRIALAVQGQTRDPDAILSRGERHLFVAPWRGYSLIGTWHKVYSSDPNDFTVTDEELELFIQEFSAGYPALDLSVDDVSMWNAGLVPFGAEQDGSPDLRYGHRTRIVDHTKEDHLENFISLIGVRFTTGRWEAERAINLVFRKLGAEPPPCKTQATTVVGGDIPSWAEFLSGLRDRYGKIFDEQVLESLAHNYGAEIKELVALVEKDASLGQPLGPSLTIRAQVVFAVREEMAQTVADVVFGRTDMATAEYPGTAALDEAAGILAQERGVPPEELSRQIRQVQQRFRPNEIHRGDRSSK